MCEWCGGDRGCLHKHRGLSRIGGVIRLGPSQVWQRSHRMRRERGIGVREGLELNGVPVVMSGVRERLVLVFHVDDVSLLNCG